MSTADIQQQFMDSIFKRDTKIHKYIKESSIPVDGRMRIYRNSTIGILVKTLKDIYPVLNELTGDDFFEAMANHFIANNPPSECDITRYGWKLAEFLATFEPVQKYPYFIDICKLEQQRQQSYYADTSPVLSSTQHPNITLQPHVYMLKSAFAINSLWIAHQTHVDMENLNINTPECTLTYRYGMDIFTKNISEQEYNFLAELKKSQSLQIAIDAQADFDPQDFFIFLMRYQLLTTI